MSRIARNHRPELEKKIICQFIGHACGPIVETLIALQRKKLAPCLLRPHDPGNVRVVVVKSIRAAALLRPGPVSRAGMTAFCPLSTATLVLLATILLAGGCTRGIPRDYKVREGDIVFQSLPHSPLVDTIEGATLSPYSHCGIVAGSDGRWVVIEAIGPVKETPLPRWIAQGRGEWFAAYRLDPAFSAQIPAIVSAARRYLGRPYDIHYQFDDERIYCSELVFKAIKEASGRSVGKIQRLGDLNWQPYAEYISSIEMGIPLEREMITPRALAEAPELTKVYEQYPEKGLKTLQKPPPDG
jgi:hypothetical protein